LKRYQQQGHHPIALIGGATGMIGDPRPTTERSLQTLDEINQNIVGISAQIRSILCNTDLPVTIVNNYDWLSKIDILTFLRDFGKHFNVNYMIAKDIVSSRLATGISFTEFTYTILQAADWLHLYQNHQCEMQIGGSDQWGNLTSGSELIRKVVGNQAKVFGVTSPLITNSDGSKFGKSEGKNIWLDPQKTDSYQFYQYWINVSDNDIIDFMKRLSFKTVDEIMSLSLAMETQAHLRLPQKALAEELTELVFGKEGLISALKITEVLFSGQFDQLSLSELEVALAEASFGEVWEDTLLIDCLVLVGAAKSKREARDLITGGSVLVNGNKMADLEFIVQKENALHKSLTVIRKGKKYYFVIRHI
jgi:tyrosyl-tRNA synthetase